MITSIQLEQLDEGLLRGVHCTLTSTEVRIFIKEMLSCRFSLPPTPQRTFEPLWITGFTCPIKKKKKKGNSTTLINLAL